MTIIKDNKTALIFGASGLIGSYLIDELLTYSTYRKVISFGRKKLDKSHSKLTQHIVDFDKIATYADLIKGDDLYCCLGTTIKKAGSQEAFRKVDYEYIVQIAKLGAKNNVNQFLLVSAVDADAESSIFYNKVKGETEEAIKDLDYWAKHIMQPSLLLGKRDEKRFGERVGQVIGGFVGKITGNMLTKYKPVEAKYVAKAMLRAAQKVEGGIITYPSHHLQYMAEQMELERNKK